MDVDEQTPIVAVSTPTSAVPALNAPETHIVKLEAIAEAPTIPEILPLEVKTEPANVDPTSTPPEEVTAENNDFYRLAMADFEDWGASVPRIVSSPVTMAHLSNLPPISSLSVYSAIYDASTIQSSLDNSTRTYGALSSRTQFAYVPETSPFLCGNLKRLWHPFPAPPSSLIDSSLPNPLQEWLSMSLHASVPQMEILVDPENLAQDGVLIKWRSVSPFAKVRRFGKRAATPIEPIVPAIVEVKEIPEPHVPIKPLPRNAKKRLRENHVSETPTPEIDGEKIAKRRKEGNDLCIRIPVSLALSIIQSSLPPSNKRRNSLQPNGNHFPVEPSAAELLASFQTS